MVAAAATVIDREHGATAGRDGPERFGVERHRQSATADSRLHLCLHILSLGLDAMEDERRRDQGYDYPPGADLQQEGAALAIDERYRDERHDAVEHDDDNVTARRQSRGQAGLLENDD